MISNLRDLNILLASDITGFHIIRDFGVDDTRFKGISYLDKISIGHSKYLHIYIYTMQASLHFPKKYIYIFSY